METLIVVVALILGSSVLTAVVTSHFNRRKIGGEAFDATASGVQKIVASSIDLVEQYKAEMEMAWSEVKELRLEVGRLEKRVDEEIESRLAAEARTEELEQAIKELQQELSDLRAALTPAL